VLLWNKSYSIGLAWIVLEHFDFDWHAAAMMRASADDRAETAAEDALCARLSGEDVPLSSTIVATARRHRMHLVLAAAARAEELAEPAGAAILAELRKAEVVEIIRERTLRSLLHQFAAAGVDALLLKGAGLAYTLYPSPHVRPRADLDLMVARAALERAGSTLAAGGWMRAAESDAELVTAERHYVLSGVLGGPAAFAEQLDLHWKIAIPQLFGDTVTFEELRSRAVPVAALGPHARTLSAPDALFVACLHRVAHHQDVVDLLWLWDIHLLASHLSDEERARFAGLAARASMRAVCARGLELASVRFRTAGAADLIAVLRPPPGQRPEPSARFLGGLRQVDVLRTDLSVLPGWRQGFALVAEHLFPPAGYIRSIYPRCPAAALPLAYVFRIVRGAPKWFRRSN
jgi:putative nucleotidyltransferase-like protein